MKKYISLIFLLVISFNINAQVPQGFNYQATVRNSSGDLVMNQNVYFKFNILQGSQTAVPSYTEVHYVPTDDLGQVTLVIGQGSATTGDFSELNWSLGSYYLGIEIDANTGNGYVAMGTTQFFSVPYALYSESSGSSGSSNLPDGTNDGDSLIWDSSTNNWVVNNSEFCQIQLSTSESTDVAATSATLNGVISIDSGDCQPPNSTSQGFVYGTNIQPNINDDTSVLANGASVSYNLQNLVGNTTYYYRSFLTNISGTYYGNEISFSTPFETVATTNFITAIEECLSTNPVNGLCTSSRYGPMPGWDVSNVTNMTFAFLNRTDFNGDIGGWDVSNVTSMQGVFSGASTFNQPLSDWDTSNVIYMYEMFKEAPSFNQDISNWNTSNVTSMTGMFRGSIYDSSSFNQPIGDWDVSSVIQMGNMFYYARAFNQDISGWDTSSVINMNGMFYYAQAFNQDISGWDVSNVTNMQEMFYATSTFNQDISGWDVSNVTNMREMFRGSSLNQPIGEWDVSSVNDMQGMFSGASTFNQPLSDWDTSNVTNMYQMFQSASSFNQDISNWNVVNVLNCRYFASTGFINAIYWPNFTNCDPN